MNGGQRIVKDTAFRAEEMAGYAGPRSKAAGLGLEPANRANQEEFK
jgi:hypothetical protein